MEEPAGAMRPSSTAAGAARRLVATLGAVLVLALAPPAARAAPGGPYDDPATALLDYVAAEDGAYRYRLVDSDFSGDGYAVHFLRMVSQRWRDRDEVRPVVWRHWLVVIVPDELSKGTAALVVAGGSSDSERPSLDDDEIRLGAQLAVLSESVVAVVLQVPHQPLSFPDEPLPLEEDALVAYSWDKALETGDYSWPVYLPMVKAAVRAMDTVQDFVPSVDPGAAIEGFVVVGASKRGAVTWLTAAADERVEAIAPMVIDILKFPEQVEHHLAVYGAYAPAIADYVEYGLVQRVDTPEGRALMQVIDPYAYLDLLDVPKYIINSTGDQFFPPDSSRFYFGDLPGESLLRYIPDTDHSFGTSDAALIDAVGGLFGWYLAVVNDIPRPAVTWRRKGGKLTVTASPPPLAARLWRATNPDARDFRFDAIGAAWRDRELKPVEPGVYTVAVPPPRTGWKAYFVELAYPSAQPGLCEVYGTRVFVTPETRPFEGADPATAGDELIEAGGDPAAAPGRVDRDGRSLFDGIARGIGDEVHGAVLDEALDGGDLSDRAVRYCFPRNLDDLDDALELYARLATGTSVETLLGDQLEDIWRKARKAGGRVADGVDGGIDRGVDEVGDFIDDGADDVGDFADDAVDDAGDFADDAVDKAGDLADDAADDAEDFVDDLF